MKDRDRFSRADAKLLGLFLDVIMAEVRARSSRVDIFASLRSAPTVDDSFSALGLDIETATPREVTRAFRLRAVKLHPDHLHDDGAAFRALKKHHELALAQVKLRPT